LEEAALTNPKKSPKAPIRSCFEEKRIDERTGAARWYASGLSIAYRKKIEPPRSNLA